MKQYDYSLLDENSRQQMQFLHLKEAIEALERNQNELNRKVLDSHEVLDKRVTLLEAEDHALYVNLARRVEELEGARKVQITLNARFLALENNDIKEPPKPDKSVWDFLLRK